MGISEYSFALSRDGNAKEFSVLAVKAHIFGAMDHAVLVGARVWCFLTRCLIGSNAGFLIDFGAGVPKDQPVGDVTTNRLSLGVEQSDTGNIRRIKQVIRLSEHQGHEEFH